MKKELNIIMDNEQITINASEGTTNTDALVIAVNLFEIIKENMEKNLPKSKKVSLEKFISTTCKSLRKEVDTNGKSN